MNASLDILDIGCGTGLAGAWLKDYARSLVGVDLSEQVRVGEGAAQGERGGGEGRHLARDDGPWPRAPLRHDHVGGQHEGAAGELGVSQERLAGVGYG